MRFRILVPIKASLAAKLKIKVLNVVEAEGEANLELDGSGKSADQGPLQITEESCDGESLSDQSDDGSMI